MPTSSLSFPPAAPSAALPLVSIVALCYNHAPFVREALESIISQTYPNLEVWLVDDASTDGSQAILEEYAARNPNWHLLLLPQNLKNCRAFNAAFRQCRGEFVIDFATDDVLLPHRVASQVAAFQALPATYGVVYSNAELVDERGTLLRLHHQPGHGGALNPRPASGWVFADVLDHYFICTPTMMMRRMVLVQLGGYDEALSYEDFDFWVRASRDWQFFYQDAVTTRRRRHPRSMSTKAYQPNDPYLASNIAVCRKALGLVRTPREQAALATCLRWELRQAVRRGRYPEAGHVLALLRQTARLTPLDWALAAWSRLRTRISG